MGHHVALWRLRDEHDLPLSIPTLHRWRHRFLSRLTTNPSQPLAGMVESDEKFFRTSFKGARGWKRKNPPQLRLLVVAETPKFAAWASSRCRR